MSCWIEFNELEKGAIGEHIFLGGPLSPEMWALLAIHQLQLEARCYFLLFYLPLFLCALMCDFMLLWVIFLSFPSEILTWPHIIAWLKGGASSLNWNSFLDWLRDSILHWSKKSLSYDFVAFNLPGNHDQADGVHPFSCSNCNNWNGSEETMSLCLCEEILVRLHLQSIHCLNIS